MRLVFIVEPLRYYPYFNPLHLVGDNANDVNITKMIGA
jgi:hypothetical protein